MKTVGIIAEYNPFHNGHAYHIAKAKELSGADFAVVVMSPDFVQRGEYAVTDKYTRTAMALSCGADLVLELPVCFATGSAEYFARGAVRILALLGCVDSISFGCETDNLSLLSLISGILSSEPDIYRETLRRALREGKTFPFAREDAAVKALLHADSPGREPDIGKAAGLTEEDIRGIMRRPNNILALEYLKALSKYPLPPVPVAVKRKGSGYHETVLLPASNAEDVLPSAAALRELLYGESVPEGLARAQKLIPAEAFPFFEKAVMEKGLPSEAVYRQHLRYRLLTAPAFEGFLDVSEDIARRLENMRTALSSGEDPAALLQTKQITRGRADRVLLHLFLGITKELTDELLNDDKGAYARILGFRNSAGELLGKIRKEAQLPLVTKPAHASRLLTGPALESFEQDTLASHLYSLLFEKTETPLTCSEYCHSPVIR